MSFKTAKELSQILQNITRNTADTVLSFRHVSHKLIHFLFRISYVYQFEISIPSISFSDGAGGFKNINNMSASVTSNPSTLLPLGKRNHCNNKLNMFHKMWRLNKHDISVEMCKNTHHKY